MILGLPRNSIVSTLGAVLIYLAIAAVALVDALGVSENAISKTRRHLNDFGRQVLHRRATRTYLYSKGDRMIPWEDILDHAKEEAERLAGTPAQGTVRIVGFTGSGHVGHLVVDAKKYRNVIFQD
ncbi:uncharacterized protein BDW70DRAFT_137015 [Aspergillus foveolatus]|uniref:uncharacterized protein n=1 Tax=Aspergillus foveolatus TaxID=210207 RepID=UPI003CCD3907